MEKQSQTLICGVVVTKRRELWALLFDKGIDELMAIIPPEVQINKELLTGRTKAGILPRLRAVLSHNLLALKWAKFTYSYLGERFGFGKDSRHSVIIHYQRRYEEWIKDAWLHELALEHSQRIQEKTLEAEQTYLKAKPSLVPSFLGRHFPEKFYNNVKQLAELSGFPIDTILGKSRKKPLPYLRFMLIRKARQLKKPRLSKRNIGDLIGGRDHSTIIASLLAHTSLLKYDQWYQDAWAAFLANREIPKYTSEKGIVFSLKPFPLPKSPKICRADFERVLVQEKVSSGISMMVTKYQKRVSRNKREAYVGLAIVWKILLGHGCPEEKALRVVNVLNEMYA